METRAVVATPASPGLNKLLKRSLSCLAQTTSFAAADNRAIQATQASPLQTPRNGKPARTLDVLQPARHAIQAARLKTIKHLVRAGPSPRPGRSMSSPLPRNGIILITIACARGLRTSDFGPVPNAARMAALPRRHPACAALEPIYPALFRIY